MIYIFGDIHGAYESYMYMKRILNIGPNDQVYLLGDIFDGNSKHPGDCLKILDDVMANDNITCLMGNHEYEHIGSLLYDDWDTEMLFSPTFGGKPLYDHIRRYLSDSQISNYIDYINKKMPQIKTFTFGKNFVYMAHGSVPCIQECCNEDEISMYAMCDILDITEDYSEDVRDIAQYLGEEVPNDVNIVTITGHTPAKYYYQDFPGLFESLYPGYEHVQKPLIYGNNICMDCGCRGNSIGKEYNGFINNLSVLALNPETGETPFYTWYNSIKKMSQTA